MQEEGTVFTAFDDHQMRDTAISERNLMRAIVRSAMEDLTKRGEIYRQARQFFLSNEDYYLFSFLSICYHLGLCPKTIRIKLGLVSDRQSSSEQIAA